MILIDLDEKKVYETEVKNLHEYMEEKIEKYFKTIYDLKVDKNKILKNIYEGDATESNVFIFKNEKMYYLNRSGDFKELKFGSKDLFTINRHTHKAILECFRNWYADLKNYITNFKKYWKEVGPIYYDELFVLTIDYARKLYQKKFESFINEKEQLFKYYVYVLGQSLKGSAGDEVLAEITKIYKDFFKKQKPILIIEIEIVPGRYKQQYVILENLEIKKLSFSPIEKEIERILNNLVPKEKEACVIMNQIWNIIMISPNHATLNNVRVKEIRKKKIIATINFGIGYGIAILSIEDDTEYLIINKSIAEFIFEQDHDDQYCYIGDGRLYVVPYEKFFSFLQGMYLDYIYIVIKYRKMLKGGRKEFYWIEEKREDTIWHPYIRIF